MHLLGKMRVVMLHGFDAATHNLRDELALLAIDDQIGGKRVSAVIQAYVGKILIF